jgi:hypothetical protein
LEDITMIVPRISVRWGTACLVAAVLLVPVLAWAGVDRHTEALRQALVEARGRKARLEMVLVPEFLKRIKPSDAQEKKIRKLLKDMDTEFTRKEREIRTEAIDSDVEGPMYALKKVPDLHRIVHHASGEICFEVLSEEQYKALRATWDEVDKKLEEDSKGKTKK